MATVAEIASDILKELGRDENKYCSIIRERWFQSLGKLAFDRAMKFALEERNISEDRIAERLGVAKTTPGRWMKNEVVPRAEKLFAITTLIAKCELKEVDFPMRNEIVFHAVGVCLQTIRRKELNDKNQEFPKRDEITCLRNLVSNSRFNVFSDFSESQSDIVNAVIKQTLELQQIQCPSSKIKTGMDVVHLWQKWGDTFSLFLLTMNADSYEAVTDA